MKAYILVAWYDYYPSGGLRNIINSFDYQKDACEAADKLPHDRIEVWSRDAGPTGSCLIRVK